MALTAFQYRSGNTLAHSLDARFKLVLLALASLTVLNASPGALMVTSAAMALLCRFSRVRVWPVVRELRYFFILLGVVFAARALSTPGEPLVRVGFLLISRQGVLEGGIVCWRLFLVVILSLVFIATTRISRIKRSVAWIFSSVPGVPEKRVATMLGLIVRFIPVIFKRAGEVTAAQHARCVGLRKNPLFRLKTFSLPLLGGVFRDAGNLAMAMEARCYTEQGIRGVAPASKKDWVVLVAGIGLCGAAWMA